MGKSRVLYTGAFRFPDGDAAAKRVDVVSRLFDENVYQVDFAGWESTNYVGYEYLHNGNRCYSMGEFRNGKESLARRLFGFLFRGRNTLKWLLPRDDYKIIVAYNPSVFFVFGLFLLSKVRRFRLVLDSTEWYDGRHLPGGRYGIASMENWLRMHVFYKLFDDVICISSYLQKHFSKKNTVLIPPLQVDAVSSGWTGISREIIFLYAGNPGKKDVLTKFILAMPIIESTLGMSIKLFIAGIDSDDLLKLLRSEGVSAELMGGIKCFGRVDASKVSDLYKNAHFTILLRENKRYAWAGFPTKAVESWAHGCPIVMNNVGDVAERARFGVDSILVSEENIAKDLVVALQAIVEEGRYLGMRAAARNKFENEFSMHAYAEDFKRFLNRL